MEGNVSVKYSTKEEPWLCFRHAVIRTLQGHDVEVELGDWHSDSYMGSTCCNLCLLESISGRRV